MRIRTMNKCQKKDNLKKNKPIFMKNHQLDLNSQLINQELNYHRSEEHHEN